MSLVSIKLCLHSRQLELAGAWAHQAAVLLPLPASSTFRLMTGHIRTEETVLQPLVLGYIFPKPTYAASHSRGSHWQPAPSPSFCQTLCSSPTSLSGHPNEMKGCSCFFLPVKSIMNKRSDSDNKLAGTQINSSDWSLGCPLTQRENKRHNLTEPLMGSMDLREKLKGENICKWSTGRKVSIEFVGLLLFFTYSLTDTDIGMFTILQESKRKSVILILLPKCSNACPWHSYRNILFKNGD